MSNKPYEWGKHESLEGYWRTVALLLKDEWAERGKRIEELEKLLGATDLLDDIASLASTISIIHHRKNVDYADRETLLKAERVLKWIQGLREGHNG